jgi:hypothetical protein
MRAAQAGEVQQAEGVRLQLLRMSRGGAVADHGQRGPSVRRQVVELHHARPDVALGVQSGSCRHAGTHTRTHARTGEDDPGDTTSTTST